MSGEAPSHSGEPDTEDVIMRKSRFRGVALLTGAVVCSCYRVLGATVTEQLASLFACIVLNACLV